MVILKHYGKYSTVYAHQSRIAAGLRKGDKIAQGQLIGYVGSTGWATGPHLHYEFRVDNQPVDLVFLLLAPEQAGADHLKALARVSRLLRNQAICEKLRAASKPEALYAILTEPTAGPNTQAA